MNKAGNLPAEPNRGRLVLVHSDEYANWAFNERHVTQGRRFINARTRLLEQASVADIDVCEIESDLLPSFEDLMLVHDRDHIERVVLEGRCGEWSGSRVDLGHLALRMAGGTLLAVEALQRGDALTAVHFAGAKHHAQQGWSSGFCVFADFALAARRLSAQGKRVAILDVDAHHGDGTQNLTKLDDNILTHSIHDSTIFPGTGDIDDPFFHVYNSPLAARSGDAKLMAEVQLFCGLVDRFRPDFIFIAAGADGLAEDPLSSLQYTIEGLQRAVRYVRRCEPGTPMLIGGAGGYRPDDLTPETWARVAMAAATPVAADQRKYIDLGSDCPFELEEAE